MTARLAWCAAALAWCALVAAQVPPSGPSAPAPPLPSAATPPAVQWAEQLRRSGQPDVAVWLAKNALAELNASADAAVPLNRRIAGWLAQDGRVAEARQLFERGKALELQLFAGETGGRVATSPPVALNAQEQAWSAAWPSGAAIDPASATAQRALAALLALPRARAAQPATPSLAAAGELQVHAFAAATSLQLVLDGGPVVRVLQLAWPADERDREIGQLLALLTSPLERDRVAALAALQALYRRIGAPLDEAARAVQAGVVVLHVDGALRELPWAALHDGASFLGERYAFRVASAGRPPRAWFGRAATDAPLRIQALGVSRLPGADGPLAGVAREVCAIVAGPVHGQPAPACAPGGGVVAGEGWLDQTFTAERLQQAVRLGNASGRALLHLGTHFDLRPGRMARSTLLLGDGTRWPLERMVALDFSGHALVALAACETGSAGAAATDSLQALLIQRGAQSVLASLWRVDDASTSALMQAFYRELAGAGPAEALRRAQQAVHAQPAWAAPFFWAGFTLAAPS